jgi:hypothetical protein
MEMVREVHEHVVSELQQSSKTDTVFVVTAVLFNLVVLGINWGVASESGNEGRPPQNDWILGILIAVTILINTFATRALLAGRETRTKLISGLVTMYRDHNVDQYYDPSLLNTYVTRYKLFVIVIFCLATTSIVVPLLERLLG